MAQDDKKIKKDFRNIPGIPSGEEKPGRRGPKFSIYWIYAIIAVVLIGANLLNLNADAIKTTELEFRQKMLSAGDVDKLDLIKNKEMVRVYIKPDSLSKSFYTGKVKKPTTGAAKGPHFEFTVTDWESFNASQTAFFKDTVNNPWL
jgi:cell division protease FtsH